MPKSTIFDTYDSYNDFHLIQQSVEIPPAEPRTSFVDVPGSNGAKDLTEALGVGIKYKDRIIKWKFAMVPGYNWETIKTTVNGYLNGCQLHVITISDDLLYYWKGRAKVTSHKIDNVIKQITVEAEVFPYKLKNSVTTVSRSDLTTNYKDISISNDWMPVVPEITVGQETTIKFGNNTYTLAAGTHVVPEICFAPKTSTTLKAKLTSGSDGTISVKFQEGAL